MNKAIKTVLALTAMLAAGCSEGAVAPHTESASELGLSGGGATAALTGFDTLRFAFVIDPHHTISYNLGAGNSIVFPAGSLCDLTRSTYGEGQWDMPCVVATTSVTVNTKAWLDQFGLAHVDFDKAVRFVPTANPAGWVMLTLTDFGSATNPWANILYCHSGLGAGCVNEALLDPTVATVKDPITGHLVRRVKHFSGYSIVVGGDCDPSDPACSGGGDMSMVNTTKGGTKP